MKRSLRLEILEKVATLVTAGFGLVAALAWNEAIKDLFKTVFGQQSGLIAKFVYAAAVTIIVVVVTLKISRAANKLKEQIAKKEGDSHRQN